MHWRVIGVMIQICTIGDNDNKGVRANSTWVMDVEYVYYNMNEKDYISMSAPVVCTIEFKGVKVTSSKILHP